MDILSDVNVAGSINAKSAIVSGNFSAGIGQFGNVKIGSTNEYAEIRDDSLLLKKMEKLFLIFSIMFSQTLVPFRQIVPVFFLAMEYVELMVSLIFRGSIQTLQLGIT